jgi:dTMP kinase
VTTGRFIAFEGGEASGKSTQALRLAESLGAVFSLELYDVRIRSWLLDPSGSSPDARTEALLAAADRAEHVASVIRPALAVGRDVVCDRYAGSSLAYQGYGRGLPLAAVRALSDFASDGLWPDLVILLDVPAKDASARLRAAGAEPDRLESESAAFHARVAEGYRALAAEDPTWVLVDGRGSVDEVFVRVDTAVTSFFG